MKVLIKFPSMSTSAGLVKNGSIVDLPEDEIKKIISFRPHAIEVLEIEVASEQKQKAKKKRARNEDGTLKADDPSTPDVNEAWEDEKR